MITSPTAGKPTGRARVRRPGHSTAEIITLGLLLLLVSGAAPERAGAQATQLTPTGDALASCDDCSYEVSLTSVFPTGINFGGTVYTSVYVGTNGYMTFGHPNSSYSPLGIPGYTTGPIVAGQFDDLDPNKGGTLSYNQNAAEEYVVATFSGVAPYSTPTEAGSGANSFQIVLRTVPSDPQDFLIELRYIDMNWAGSGNISAWPTAGWSAGDGSTYGQVDVSGQSNFLTVESGSNVGVAGVYQWNVEGGVVQGPPAVTATTAVSSIGATSAESGGTVGSDGGSAVTSRGIAWSTSSGPTLADHSVTSGSGTGSFSATLSGLDPGVTYYVRAWATNVEGTAYGPERSFTTLSQLSQTITFDAIADRTYGDASFQLSATSSSGLDVAFSTDDPDVATVSGDILTITGAGEVVVTASQPGNAEWAAAAPIDRTLTVGTRGVRGAFTVPDEKVYDGTDTTRVLTRDLSGVLAGDLEDVALGGGTARYDSPDVGVDKPVSLVGASLSGSRASHYELTGVDDTSADIVAGPPNRLLINAPDWFIAGDATVRLSLVVADEYGNATAVSTSTVLALAIEAPDAAVVEWLPSTLEVLPGRSSALVTIHGTFPDPGILTVSAELQAGQPLPGGGRDERDIEIRPANGVEFVIEAANGGDIAPQAVGVPFEVRITAVNPHGDVVESFSGPVDLSTSLGTGITSGAVTGAFDSGVLTGHLVTLDAPGLHTLVAWTPTRTATGSSRPFRVVGATEGVRVDVVIDDPRPAPGDTVTVLVVITNWGASTARNVAVPDPLAGQSRLQQLVVNPEVGTVDMETGTWRIEQLDAGEQVTLEIRARVSGPESQTIPEALENR